MTEQVPVEKADREVDESGSSTRSPSPVRLAAFVTASAALVALVLVVAPALPRLLAMEKQTQFIKDSGIRAGAWFYTEVDQIPAIELLVHAAMRGNGQARGDATADVK